MEFLKNIGRGPLIQEEPLSIGLLLLSDEGQLPLAHADQEGPCLGVHDEDLTALKKPAKGQRPTSPRPKAGAKQSTTQRDGLRTATARFAFSTLRTSWRIRSSSTMSGRIGCKRRFRAVSGV